MDRDQTTLMIITEANEAFYKWEEQLNLTNLSDDERLMWIAGYLEGKGEQHDSTITQ